MKVPAVSMPRLNAPYWNLRSWVGGLALCAFALSGCGTSPTAPAQKSVGIEKSVERGPMSLTLKTSAESITTAEPLSLTLSATMEDGYAVDFPAYPEPTPTEAPSPDKPVADAPPEFTAAGHEDSEPVLGDQGRVTRSRTYKLEPFLAGTYTIPPLSVTFTKAGDEQKSTLETEAVTVTVTSVIGANAQPAIMDIAGPVSLEDPVPWGRYGLLTVLLALGAGAAYWYWFVRVVPGPPPPPPVPAHVRALEALALIQREKLVEKGLYKEYYIRVSDVLRHYMEDQFHLRAPERTTEEFLAEIQHNAVLGLQEQLLLRAFLRHCDLVKFAKAEPSSEEIRETFQTCEKFIIDSEAAHRAAKAAAAQAAAPLEA